MIKISGLLGLLFIAILSFGQTDSLQGSKKPEIDITPKDSHQTV